MAIDCCIGDFDAMSQIELPFGDTITIMGEPQYPAERELKDRRSPGYPMPRADMNRPQIEADAHADDRNIVSSEGPSSECDLETFRPLQYARRHGLTRNYFDQSPLIGACMSRLRSVPTDPDHCELTRSERVSARAAVEQAEKDRWNIDKDTAELLTLTLAMGRPDDLDEETDTVKISDLKIEEPVLASVPDMDVARLRARNAIRISTTGIKVYALDVENGESLEWPPDDLRLPSAMATFIAAEKLDIDIETADTLKEIMKRRQSDLWKAVEEAIAIDETRNVRRQTPPLLPHSPPLSPRCVSDETCEMELTSTPENLLEKDRQETEAQLFAAGEYHSGLSGSSPTYGELKATDDVHGFTQTPVTSSSSPLRRKRHRYLKEDTPLLHFELGISPAKRTKTVLFPEEICTMIPDGGTDDTLADPDELRANVSSFIQGVAASKAQAVFDEIANEKLDELDTTLRLDVPTVDIVEPLAPWMDFGDVESVGPLLPGKFFLSRLEKEIPKDSKKWSGASKLNKLFSWMPFPRHLGRITVDEQFDDGSCERYMAELSLFDAAIDVDVLLWKQAGVRLLYAQDSDDDELESGSVDNDDGRAAMDATVNSHVDRHPPAASEPPVTKAPPLRDLPVPSKPVSGRTNMQALLQRRKLELEAAHSSRHPKGTSVVQNGHDVRGIDVQTHSASLGGLGTNSLLDFMGLQGAKMPQAQPPKTQHQPTQTPVQPPAAMEQAGLALLDAVPPLAMPCPTVCTPERAMTIVISSSMLANRSLARHIQAQLLGLDMIERDPASLVAVRNTSLRPCEADLTLSPSTGLICTTSQKLKQKPLPGQTSFFGVHERIAAVSVRYESLVVLVSEGRQGDLQPTDTPDERDAAAINELIGSAASFHSSVEVCYVAGGETELARWIAACISRHCVVDEDAKLLHDETIWERLLRTAGANPSAAQMMLAKLKRPPEAAAANEPWSPDESTDHGQYGLPALVQMSAEERLQRFGPALGGGRVLEKVSAVIDGGWMSASWQ